MLNLIKFKTGKSTEQRMFQAHVVQIILKRRLITNINLEHTRQTTLVHFTLRTSRLCQTPGEY